MFWECHVVTSSIDKLLDQPAEERKLQDFLDESDLIQECLNQNKLLLDYLVQADVMQELIGHIVTMPDDSNFRNANVVSELLSGDFPRVQDVLLEKAQLDRLYSFLTSANDETLNPILASYFARIINTLIIRKPGEILSYFKSQATFKDDFLRHLDSTSITDILYRLISDSADQRSEMIKWYEDTNFIDGLIERFLTTESKSVQMNVANLLSELLRLAFDQQSGIDSDTAGSSLSATIERLLYGRNDSSEGPGLSSRFSSNSDDEKKSTNAETEEKLTPAVLAQRILSKSNLERIFDTLTQRPAFVAVGCDFLESILDLLSRQMSAPACISLTSKEPSSSTNKDEPMQINDEDDDSLPVFKTLENETASMKSTKDALLRIYLTLLEVIPSRLPPLIPLLTSPSPSLTSGSNDHSEPVKHPFISEPLGSMRLSLIKFFSKLIYTVSNDYTGDQLYDVLNSHRLFHVLIDLLLRYVYNNFLHTQVYLIIRLLIDINSIAVKQATDIWTRSSVSNNEPISESSPFHYTNRCSYKLFQSLVNPSEVNLFERLLDQYETTKLGTSSEHTRFTAPNSGHIAQLLRFLRDHALTFDNYSAVFQHPDADTNSLERRWQTVLEHLSEDEKKWSAMHLNERTTNTFRSTTATMYTSPMGSASDSAEASLRRQTFHMKSFGNRPYVDDDEEEDDEAERFDIDDEMMKNDLTTNEKKVADMKKTSFEPEFPPKFNEDTLWYQDGNDDGNSKKAANDSDDNNRMSTPPTLPDLFENHRSQQERTAPATESNFEQLCSLRANDNNSGGGLFPFQSSSTLRDEAISPNDPFWQNQPIYLANSRENHLTTRLGSSSSEDESDENESSTDPHIPDDEKYFVDNDVADNAVGQANNMMDIFRRQPSNPAESSRDRANDRSSTPERQDSSPLGGRPMLDFVEQENGASGSDDENDDLTLQDNFSFLIARGMLKPSS